MTNETPILVQECMARLDAKRRFREAAKRINHAHDFSPWDRRCVGCGLAQVVYDHAVWDQPDQPFCKAADERRILDLLVEAAR